MFTVFQRVSFSKSVKLELHLLIIVQACVPYFEMLEKWIYKGIIQDPYAEVRSTSSS